MVVVMGVCGGVGVGGGGQRAVVQNGQSLQMLQCCSVAVLLTSGCLVRSVIAGAASSLQCGMAMDESYR